MHKSVYRSDSEAAWKTAGHGAWDNSNSDSDSELAATATIKTVVKTPNAAC